MKAQDKGIVLRAIRYGEADLILSVLTPKGVRLQLFARSALKSKKRFGGGVLEPTHFISVSYEDRRARIGGESDLHSLHEASLLEAFSGLRSNYERLELALYFLQVAEKVARSGGAEGPELFDLVGNSLKAAEVTEHLDRLRVHFETRVLALQGVLELESSLAALAGRPVSQHAAIEISDIDWTGLGRTVSCQLKVYLETGMAES